MEQQAGTSKRLMDAIWRGGRDDPEARAAFETLAADHGRRFAEGLRETIETAKAMEQQEAEIRALGTKKNRARKSTP
jgi:hypothetical protein